MKPSARELLRFEQKGGMLRNILTPQVPAVAAKHAGALLQEVLSESGIQQADLCGWVMHPGGRDVTIGDTRQAGSGTRGITLE